MTSLAPDFHEHEREKRDELQELELCFPFLQNSLEVFKNLYTKKSPMAGSSQPIGIKLVFESQFRSAQIEFLEQFLWAEIIDGSKILFEPELKSKKLKTAIEKDLKDFDPGITDYFLYDLTLAENSTSTTFIYNLIYNFFEAFRKKEMERIKVTIDLVEPYHRYFKFLVYLLANGVKETDLYYFMEKSSYSNCPGYLIEPFKKFIYYVCNKDISISRQKFLKICEEKIPELYKPSVYCDDKNVEKALRNMR